MNELLKQNLLIIKMLKEKIDLYEHLKFGDDKIWIDDIEIDLKTFDLSTIFNDKVLDNLENLDIENIKALAQIALNKDDVLAKDDALEEQQKTNPKIKNFKILKKVREDGSILEYPYYIDEANHLHVLFNFAGTNILAEYQKLFLKLGGEVRSKDLYECLERKMQNVELTEDFRNKTMSEANKFEAELVNSNAPDERVMLNSEHDIYALNNTLYSHNLQTGGLNQSTYNNDEADKEAQYKDDFSQENLEVKDSNREVAKIITLEEYLLLIKYTNSQENPDVGLFEEFMENVMTYQDYVDDDILSVLFEYQRAMASIQSNSMATNYELEALKKYNEMLLKVDENKSKIKKENVQIRTRKLEDEYRNAGFGVIYLIFGVTLIILIVMIILLVVKF